MRDIKKITTEQMREASGKGFVSSLGYRSVADNEFDYWLATERNRVAELVKAKERKRIIKIIMAGIGEVIWKAKTTDEPIDMSNIYNEIMKED